jgi:hypothetical protein
MVDLFPAGQTHDHGGDPLAPQSRHGCSLEVDVIDDLG